MTQVILRGTLDCTTDEQAERVERALPAHIAATRAEAGCVAFDVDRIAGSRSWAVSERFADEAAFEAHSRRGATSPWGVETADIPRHYVVERDTSILSPLGPIPATFVTPVASVDVGALVLLHGTGSQRHEVADAFARLADALAERGLASIRIDFAGCGDSGRPQTEFTVTSQVSDASAAVDWLRERPGIDPERIGVLGFSQGGQIAALLAGGEERVAALVSWSSGVISVEDKDASFAHLFAADEEEAVLDMGFTTFAFSRTWWDQFRALDAAAAVGSYTGPVLAVAGTADDVVRPRASTDLLAAAGGADVTMLEILDADHIFDALDPTRDRMPEVIAATVDWVASRLAR